MNHLLVTLLLACSIIAGQESPAQEIAPSWKYELTMEYRCSYTASDECKSYRVHVSKTGWVVVSVQQWSEESGETWSAVVEKQLSSTDVAQLEKAVNLVGLPKKPRHYSALNSDTQTVQFTIRTDEREHQITLDGPFFLLDAVGPDSPVPYDRGIARYIELWAACQRSVPPSVDQRGEEYLLAAIEKRSNKP